MYDIKTYVKNHFTIDIYAGLDLELEKMSLRIVPAFVYQHEMYAYRLRSMVYMVDYIDRLSVYVCNRFLVWMSSVFVV